MTFYPDLIKAALPEDAADATLAGRGWRPDLGGPGVIGVRDGQAIDVAARVPTMRDLCEAPDPGAALKDADGDAIGSVAALAANALPETRDRNRPWLLAPIDLQAIKAA